MSPEFIALTAGGLLLAMALLFVVYRTVPKRLKPGKFEFKWKELQAYCKDKSTWPDAIRSADKLLDEALKKRKFSGGSMGERLVSAHEVFTDHDSVWQAHNLYKKLVSDEKLTLKEADVKKALLAFRQALRDIGALPSGESGKK